MSNPGVHGPIHFVLIEFPGDHTIGAAATALLDLADRGIIRVYDLLMVRKDEDRTFAGIDVADISADGVGGFTAFAGARSGLLDDEDLRQAQGAGDPHRRGARRAEGQDPRELMAPRDRRSASPGREERTQ